MKKSVFIAGFFIIIIFAAVSIQAQANLTEENQKVSEAYSCLQSEISERSCASLSTDEKIFSLLSIGKCQSELIASSSNSGECWPSGDCDVKTTAQAVLALDNVNVNTAKAKSWLLAQQETPAELQWYLEIESSSPTTCTISYPGTSVNVNIGEDKKISNNAGPCLVLAEDDYWLRISPVCFDYTFDVSCDQNFLTTLLFRKTGSSTIHVSPDSSSASSGGTTREKVESSCFNNPGSTECTYEGSLWASLVLDSLEEDVSPILPYLITVAVDNRLFLPDSFLYTITGEDQYKNSLLSLQKSSQWWAESGDRYYDTALALYPFQGETITEKTNSKEWLLGTQETSGCWDSDSVRNTGFVLASIWPKTVSGSGTSGPSCTGAGFYCVGAGSCQPPGEILSEYDCPGVLSACCSVEPQQQTCEEQGGEICNSGQACRQGTQLSAGDTESGQVCCVGNTAFCENVQTNECENFNGVCRTTSCNSNEESSFYSCGFSGETCCLPAQTGPRSLAWVWILVILIILVVVGIIFRDKLRILWFRMKSKFGRGGSRGPSHGPIHRPGPPSHPGPRPGPRPFQERRILLPSPEQGRPAPRKAPSRTQKELDEVLKKLKDMSK
jgi:hypothetical protein